MADSELNTSRPLSPHIMTWKWHVTMATSIFHRATGIANYVGAFLLVGWLVSITLGEEAYESFAGLVGSPLSLLVLFGFTLSIVYHFLNGIRHLFWDAGTGYQPKTADLTAWVSILGAVVVTVAIWAYVLTQMVEL
ncbi:MAG: succinate dehydrogenase, cytochrome b556 subunit [Ponticaulis sp.]|nr:succinate dehydrogenase, cytochrome b556 subunit [Ponticaulis sp.]